MALLLEKWPTQWLLGSKEQAKPEACSKSLHSLAEDVEALDCGASDTRGCCFVHRWQRLRGCMAVAGTPGQGGAGTVNLLESLGFFPGPGAYSCCRRELFTAALALASLLCCLRMAKTKAKHTMDPLL